MHQLPAPDPPVAFFNPPNNLLLFPPLGLILRNDPNPCELFILATAPPILTPGDMMLLSPRSLSLSLSSRPRSFSLSARSTVPPEVDAVIPGPLRRGFRLEMPVLFLDAVPVAGTGVAVFFRTVAVFGI